MSYPGAVDSAEQWKSRFRYSLKELFHCSWTSLIGGNLGGRLDHTDHNPDWHLGRFLFCANPIVVPYFYSKLLSSIPRAIPLRCCLSKSVSPPFFCASLIIYLRSVSYTHLRAHETRHDLVCRLLL